MFNPKNSNLLDQQLDVSGLGMTIDPFTAISAGIGIVSGVSKIAGAKSKADADEKAYKEQKKLQKQLAKNQNKYNAESFEAKKENFEKMREYNFETALTRWRYNQNIQDYQYNQQVRAYNRDQQNLANTLKVNDIAARQGFVSEQRVMREIAAQQSFERTNSYIENLQTAGRARLGSAGKSSHRAMQMTAAEHGRNLAILDASFTSAITQHKSNMFDIALSKFGADLNARANAMLRPERLPDIPSPTEPPEPVWVEPLKIEPGYVGKPSRSSTMLGGIAGAAQDFAGVAGTIGAEFGKTPTKVPQKEGPRELDFNAVEEYM